MIYEPIFNRVLLKPKPITEKIKGSIILPESVVDNSEPLNFGTIISVGHKVEVLKIGESVIYPKSIGTPIVIEDEDYLIMAEADIIMHEPNA